MSDNNTLENRGWQDMSSQLDQHLPLEERKKRPVIWWWIGSAVALLISGIFYFEMESAPQLKVKEVAEQIIADVSTMEPKADHQTPIASEVDPKTQHNIYGTQPTTTEKTNPTTVNPSLVIVPNQNLQAGQSPARFASQIDTHTDLSSNVNPKPNKAVQKQSPLPTNNLTIATEFLSSKNTVTSSNSKTVINTSTEVQDVDRHLQSTINPLLRSFDQLLLPKKGLTTPKVSNINANHWNRYGFAAGLTNNQIGHGGSIGLGASYGNRWYGYGEVAYQKLYSSGRKNAIYTIALEPIPEGSMLDLSLNEVIVVDDNGDPESKATLSGTPSVDLLQSSFLSVEGGVGFDLTKKISTSLGLSYHQLLKEKYSNLTIQGENADLFDFNNRGLGNALASVNKYNLVGLNARVSYALTPQLDIAASYRHLINRSALGELKFATADDLSPVLFNSGSRETTFKARSQHQFEVRLAYRF